MGFQQVSLSHSQQLYFKDKSRTSWYSWLRELAISHFGRNIKFPLVAYMHLLHRHNPTIYQIAQSHRKRSSATAGIKLLAIDGPTRIMSSHNAALAWLCPIWISLFQHLIIYTTRECFHTFLLSLFFQPTLVGLYIFSFCHISDYMILYLRR